MKNLHKAYYKDYFAKMNFETDTIDSKKNEAEIQRNNDLLISERLKIIPNELANCKFSYIVAYPGLVTGVGINHEAKIKGEFKLGVHFDYTYGMPVVYGSSVKGVLRFYFKNVLTDEFKKKLSVDFDTEAAFDEIFNGLRNGEPISIYERDIFFDAVITKENKKSCILASDSITPHTEGLLKDPIPLTFMKIASGCTLEFRFRLSNSSKACLPAADKIKIFKEIIETFGIGAKTNVGYGQFETKGHNL